LREARDRLARLAEFGLGDLKLDLPFNLLSNGEKVREALYALSLGGISDGVVIIEDVLDLFDQTERVEMFALLRRYLAGPNALLVSTAISQVAALCSRQIEIGAVRGCDDGVGGEGEAPAAGVRRISGKKVVLVSVGSPQLEAFELTVPCAKIIMLSGRSGAGKSAWLRELSERQLKGSADFLAPGEKPESLARTLAGDTGVLDRVSALYASLLESRLKGFDKTSFSTQRGEMRCSACGGAGELMVGEDDFDLKPGFDALALTKPCSQCQGLRFRAALLSIRYRGRNLGEVLLGKVREAMALFVDEEDIRHELELLCQLGFAETPFGLSLLEMSHPEFLRVQLFNILKREKGLRSSFRQSRGGGNSDRFLVLDDVLLGLGRPELESCFQIFRRLNCLGRTVICCGNNEIIRELSDFEIRLERAPHGRGLATINFAAE
jgi:excinuclease ABC subunit A